MMRINILRTRKPKKRLTREQKGKIAGTCAIFTFIALVVSFFWYGLTQLAKENTARGAAMAICEVKCKPNPAVGVDSQGHCTCNRALEYVP